MIKETTEELKKLQKDIQEAHVALEKLNEQYRFEITKSENNVYTGDKDTALMFIEEYLISRAEDDCRGKYNCGQSEYKQNVTINGTKYLCTLTVEYNRHDKTYYYIEYTDFESVEI